MDRTKIEAILNFPSEQEQRAVRRLRALTVAADNENDLVAAIILRLPNATAEQLRACLLLLALCGPNLDLATWACEAPAEQAQSILSLASSFSEVKTRISPRPRSRKRKR